MKEDDKEVVEDDEEKEKKEKYTNFEHLKAKVEVMQEELELVGEILRQNNLVKTTKEEVDTDIEDSTYKRLEGEL